MFVDLLNVKVLLNPSISHLCENSIFSLPPSLESKGLVDGLIRWGLSKGMLVKLNEEYIPEGKKVDGGAVRKRVSRFQRSSM